MLVSLSEQLEQWTAGPDAEATHGTAERVCEVVTNAAAGSMDDAAEDAARRLSSLVASASGEVGRLLSQARAPLTSKGARGATSSRVPSTLYVQEDQEIAAALARSRLRARRSWGHTVLHLVLPPAVVACSAVLVSAWR